MSATLPGGRPVDIELLGEFFEGLLPPDATGAVRALVASDPAWATALAELRDAAPVVEAALASYADETAGPMPPDVGDRLTTALRLAREPSDSAQPGTIRPSVGAGGGRTPPTTRRTRREPSTRPATSAAPATTTSTAKPPTTKAPSGRRLASRALWTRGGVATVLLLAVVGIGFLIKLGPAGTTSASSGSVKLAEAPDRVPHPPDRPNLAVTASGTNYTSATFGAHSTAPVPLSAGQPSTGRGSAEGPAAVGPAGGRIPASLDRLLDPAALDVCLHSIETIGGGTAQSVDFATYDGGAAVIVTLVSPASVVAAGPSCGIDGAAHQLAVSPPH